MKAQVLRMILASVMVVAPLATAISLVANAAQGDTSSIRLTLSIGEYEITKDEDGFDVIRMEGFSLALVPGYPRLPHKVYNIVVPPDVIWSSLQLRIISAQTRTLDGTYDIEPASPPLPGTGDWRNDRNVSVYEADARFPENSVEILPYSQMRKWKFTRVDFFPFQYNPVSKRLTLTERVEIEISYSQSRAPLDESLMADAVMDDIATQIFLNYSEARRWYEQEVPTEPQQTYDYVIITTNAIETNSTKLASFVTHKEGLGHSVLVITEDEFGVLTGQPPNHKAEKIREWLKNNYSAHSIEYVLLIGDPHPYESGEGDIPMKMCHPEMNQTEYECEPTPTDYFYADLTGNWDKDGDQYYGEWLHDYPVTGGVDFTPEVYVGRIPVYNADYTALDSILQKIIDYETEPNANWRKSILMPMGFQESGYDGAMLAEQMKDDYLDAAGFTSWRMYQQGSGVCGPDSTYTSEQELMGGTAVRDRWAGTDYGIVAWWGHGSATSASVGYGPGCWDGTLMNSSYTSSLDDSHPALTYQCSCTNGYPENSNNLQYAVLKQGGIGTVSATRVSWYSPDDEYGEFDGSPTNSGIGYEYVHRLVQGLPGGDALYQTKHNMNPNHQCWLMNWYDFNLYGDPAISLESAGALAVTSITPSSGLNTGTVHITNLAGSNFQSGATVKLTKLGQPDINATNVIVVSASKITCDFDLTGAATGQWDVVVTNPDTRTGRLPNGFTVKTPGGEEFTFYLPLVMRRWPPIPDTPVLNPISNPDGDGNYTVSWNPAYLADTYALQEDDNAAFSSPTTQYTGSGTSWDASGKATGTYYYRVKASNSWGDSGWSNVQSVIVQPPSGPTPGFWEGTYEEFYVTPDGAYVDDFAIYVYVPECGYYKITHTPQEPISNNQFSFTGSFYADGTFSDSTHCSGQEGLDNFYIPGCGYVSGGPWSYDATWQHGSIVRHFHATGQVFTEGAKTPDPVSRVERIGD